MAGRIHSTKSYALISDINDILVGRVIADARAGLAIWPMWLCRVSAPPAGDPVDKDAQGGRNNPSPRPPAWLADHDLGRK
jgi:hypothetical protein